MNQPPTIAQVFAMCRQVVIDMAYQPGLQLNTYCRVDVRPDLESNSLGMSYDDYENGDFWARSWYAGKLDPDKIKAEYPILFAELGTVTGDGIQIESEQYEISLVFVDKIECATCPPHIVRNGPTVSAYMLRVARAAVNELATYALWEVNEPGEDLRYEWISQGRAQYYGTQGWSVVRMDRLELYIETRRPQFRQWGDEFFPDLRGVAVTLRFGLCEDDGLGFEYNTPNVPSLATNDCPC